MDSVRAKLIRYKNKLVGAGERSAVECLPRMHLVEKPL